MMHASRRVSVLLRHLRTSPEKSAPPGRQVARETTATAATVPARSAFKYFLPIQSRWKDNDQYGHINNTVFYSYMDTIINHWLIKHAGLKTDGEIIGLCVSSSCQFLRSLEYPDVVDTGLRIMRLGNSSVEYEVGIFKHGESETAALGRFTHVFVDSDNRRPTPIPDGMRTAMRSQLVVE